MLRTPDAFPANVTLILPTAGGAYEDDRMFVFAEAETPAPVATVDGVNWLTFTLGVFTTFTLGVLAMLTLGVFVISVGTGFVAELAMFTLGVLATFTFGVFITFVSTL